MIQSRIIAIIVLSLVLFASGLSAQSVNRRGEPSALSSGYYVVDNNEYVPASWRPNYFFVDTSYQRSEWTLLASGSNQGVPDGGYFFNPAGPDSTKPTIAGPISLNLKAPWNFYGVNYNSVFISSQGFIGFRPYSEVIAGTPPMYAPSAPVDLKNNATSAPRAIIAAMWGALDMVHGGKTDTSLVYYRTSPTRDTFYVNFYNMRLRPSAPNNFTPAGFTAAGADRIFLKKFQIVLIAADSSIQINYGPFSGSVNNYPPLLAWRLFEGNCSIGLVSETQKGGTVQSTSVLYGAASGGPRWDAVNAACANCNKEMRQSGQWALRFRRWHNVMKASAVLFPPRNFEVCLGESITPRARFTNVDTVTLPSVKVSFQIRNVVTGTVVYDSSLILRNIPPGASVDTTFPDYQTVPNILAELGTFDACAISTSLDAAGKSIGDAWPYDDNACIRIFGVRRTTQPFRDASNNYGNSSTYDFPDQTMWVSRGAVVVDGDDATWDPPPPRDPSNIGYGPDGFHSPVIRLDRSDENGNSYVGTAVGDTLTSFPINLLGQTRCTLTFDYMRSGKQYYPWLWDATTALGPEKTIVDKNGKVVRVGDSLILEFKNPSDSECNPTSWNEIAAIDGGQDFEFKSLSVQLQSLPVNYFTSDFRFRFRLKANNGPYPAGTVDDDDPWYIDNPTLLVPHHDEIEVKWVRVVSPYSKLPASQAVFPIYVNLINTSADPAPSFITIVRIKDPNGVTVDSEVVRIDTLLGSADTIIQLPSWDARNLAARGLTGEYTAEAWIHQGYDTYPDVQWTYTKFYLNVESGDQAIQEFAYDHAGLTPGSGSGNDVPGYVQNYAAGIGFNSGSGSFAMKFQVQHSDVLYGARLYFAAANASPDMIRISLLNGDPSSCTPGDTVSEPGAESTFEDIRRGGFFNQFWSYYFPKPIALKGALDGASNKGVYWISVSQLGLNNMELGGDFSRGGGIVEVSDPTAPKIAPINSDPYGTQWGPGSSDNSGDVSCAWAMEQPAGSGNWVQWMPTSGFWPTMPQAGKSLSVPTPINLTSETSAGSYMPMIRPIFANYTPTFGKIESAKPPEGFGFDRSAPNPFVASLGSTEMSYHLSESGLVTLAIYNQLGQRVRTLVRGNMSVGVHSTSWDGRDESGLEVAPGCYVCQLISGERSATMKVMVVK